jgi:ATP-binding cassette subfamily B protein
MTTPAKSDKHYTFKKQFKFLITCALEHKGPLFLGIIGLLIGVGANLSIPWAINHVVTVSLDSGIKYKSDLEPGSIYYSAAIFCIIFALQGISFFVRSYGFGSLGHHVAHTLRTKLYSRLLSFPTSYFDQEGTGRISTALSSDITMIQDAVGMRLSVILRYLIQVIGGVGAMIMISGKLTLGIVLTLPVLVLISMTLGKMMRKESRLFQKLLGETAASAQESFLAVRLIQAHGLRENLLLPYELKSTRALGAGIRRTRIGGFMSSFLSFLLNILLVVLIACGLFMMKDGAISAGAFSAFVLYAIIVGVSFGFVAHSTAEFLQAFGAADWVMYQLLEECPDKNPLRGTQYGDFTKDITLNNVSFSYRQEDGILKETLKNCSLIIPPSSTIALVGPSGGGKSTLAAIILGLYEPSQGTITLGATEYKDLNPYEFRKYVGFVPQQPELISGTLRDNLMLESPMASETELLAACTQAGLTSLIASFPQGLDTSLGEIGKAISGGQKQRIAIARALIRKPKLLILDEATSALDSENEALIQKTLEAISSETSVIIIAHRLFTIQKADHIYVIDQGTIVEDGTHEKLLAQNGLYHLLVHNQILHG